jgi:hypothetical protein
MQPTFEIHGAAGPFFILDRQCRSVDEEEGALRHRFKATDTPGRHDAGSCAAREDRAAVKGVLSGLLARGRPQTSATLTTLGVPCLDGKSPPGYREGYFDGLDDGSIATVALSRRLASPLVASCFDGLTFWA